MIKYEVTEEEHAMIIEALSYNRFLRMLNGDALKKYNKLIGKLDEIEEVDS